MLTKDSRFAFKEKNPNYRYLRLLFNFDAFLGGSVMDFTVTVIGGSPLAQQGLIKILNDAGVVVVEESAFALHLDSTNLTSHLVVGLVDDPSAIDCAEFVAELRRRFPGAKVVVLTHQYDLAAAKAAFGAGAMGFVLDQLPTDALLASFNLAANGVPMMPAQMAQTITAKQGADGAKSTLAGENLSDREREVLRCLVMGDPNKLISRKLDISEATVKVHVKALLRKLKVANRTQAAIKAIGEGLVPDVGEEAFASEAIDTALVETWHGGASDRASVFGPHLVALHRDPASGLELFR